MGPADRTLFRASLWIGAAIWVARLFVAGIEPSRTHWAVTLLLLSPLVLAPLVLQHTQQFLASRAAPLLDQVARVAQLPAAALLVPACVLPPSLAAMLPCLPWAAVTLLLAAAALRRVLRCGWRPLSDLSIASGFLFLPIGAGWLCLWRRGIRPLDFDEIIVLLTAIHFHFAGFILPLLAGWSARHRPGRFADAICLGVLVGVPAVAAGITLSKLGYPLVLETVAACGLSLAGIATAGLQVAVALCPGRCWPARGLLVLSSVALVGTMLLAALYGLRPYHNLAWLDIPWMRAWHGTGNALGACLCGVVGHLLVGSPAEVRK